MRHIARPTQLLSAFSMMFAIPAILPAQPVSHDSIEVVAVSAQATTVRATPSTRVTGAPLTGLRAGVHLPVTSRPATPADAAATHANLGTSRAMMVVGLAGLIVGAIIGGTPGTIIMVGGALVGLKGLYDYMQ